MGEGRTDHPRRRLTVAQAADQLGISVDAMRARVKRETVATEREGGRVYVLLDIAQDTDQGATRAGESSALISRLESEVAFLRDQVRRQQEIIAQQAVTVRQLTAASSQEATEDAVTVEEASEGSEPRSYAAGAQEATERPQRRPWWRRVMGG